MPAEIIDGNQVAQDIIHELKARIEAHDGRPPHVVFVRVGEDPASVSYVRKKELTAAKLGMNASLEVYPEDISQEALAEHVMRLNTDDSVDGILVQSPMGAHIDEQYIFNLVSPEKDVDGFNAQNLGLIAQEDPNARVSCTPSGIMELLKRSGVETSGKHAVVLGRSLIVGKTVAQLLIQKSPTGNATVTTCHSRTQNLADFTRSADILVAAIGKPEFVTADMVKPGAVVIDVGVNRIPDASKKRGYRIAGDVHFESVSQIASKITPVPGGVGPMTVSILMRNTFEAMLARQAKG
ncbi:MAG: bifunctional 5,10-methylenetetrahydrofolate dehydrogenase/5,10-methenyltetrahydrofolate cyclohydrolase [Opitutales bacterium]|nr:bifunctional 5,10-methylenetetrahydrofolate dehydrogenase/5,10-methenyltetrahydrofolate cyclohydrolase [Opitutales bacterium]NRA25656.1 bifunctional 5,10-methylenetetrahydrofolate dehydrogenase/5,10-methenyltetrahydrofolate cyclohydrolase [Opitutales bacterium]